MSSRTTKSFYNAFTAVILAAINGILGIILSNLIIKTYGSDFNGLNSSASQIVNVLLVLEGGFTIASNVALFAPLGSNNYDVVNSIINATRKKFQRIGILFIILGIIISVIYAFIIQSELSRNFILILLLITILPQGINLFFASTYRIIFQAEQKEYIITICTIITTVLSQIANLVTVILNGPMVLIRINSMVFSICNTFIIIIIGKKKHTFLDKKINANYSLIKGTNDVFIQKITSVVYNSFPILLISILLKNGTTIVSVYAVYNNVYYMLKSLLNGVIDAPRLSLGQLISEKSNDVVDKFKEYEFFVLCLVYIVITSAATLVLPFVDIYSKDFNDYSYHDSKLALMLSIIAVLELIHIPSGNLINMSGHFKISKNIQLVACLVLIVSTILGGLIWGLYGIIISLLITSLLLALLEIYYVHIKYLNMGVLRTLRIILPIPILSIVVSCLSILLPINLSSVVNNYFKFVISGIIIVMINFVVVVLMSMALYRKELKALTIRILRLLKIKKRS